MLIPVGHAQLKGKRLCFDQVGWSMVKQVAKKQHKSPRTIVLGALRRYANAQKTKKS